jgi:hypothetical protein
MTKQILADGAKRKANDVPFSGSPGHQVITSCESSLWASDSATGLDDALK